MSDITPTTIQKYGWVRDSLDPRDWIYNLEEKILTHERLPQVVSLRKEMPPIYNQGQLGSCTANGSGAIFEREQMAQGEGQTTPSRLFIYYNERAVEGTVNSDSGAQVRTAIKVLASQGAPAESIWPYDISKFTEKPPVKAYEEGKKHEAIQYHRIITGGPGSPVRTALHNGHPIVFGFVVPDYFESEQGWNSKNEPLPLPTQGTRYVGGHCVVLIGYDFSLQRFDRPVFEVRNSWGSEWGDEGNFWMDASWITRPELGLSSDFWVIRRVS